MGVGFVDGGRGSDVKNYPGKVNGYVIVTCIVGALGGLTFGYDIGISGGVTSMAPFLKKFFPSVYRQEALDTSTNQYCKFNSSKLTMFTSSLYLAALLASLFASWVTKRLGRKWSMFFGGLVFLAGAVLNAAAQNIAMLIVGRILLGIGVGFSTQSAPLYVSEMAPYKHRGALNIIFQLAITAGIFVANMVNYLFNKVHGGWGWRLSLGGAAVPALIITISAFFLPNTPNSILEQGHPQKAREMLRRIRGVSDIEVEAEYNDLEEASKASKAVENSWKNLVKDRQYRPQLVMAICIPFFQQLTGMNVIMFYAPVLFKTMGFGDNASLLSAVVTGIVNVVATFVSIYGIDKWGRRFLFIQGGIQMVIFQALVAGFIGWKFGVSGDVTQLPEWYAVALVIFICGFVAAFAWSWGPLGWLVPSEIFPLEIRSAAQSVTVSVNMLWTFLIAQFFLMALCGAKFYLFIIFAACVVVMTLFIYLLLPETKNVPIEEMSKVWKQHWHWKRFMNVGRPQV